MSSIEKTPPSSSAKKWQKLVQRKYDKILTRRQRYLRKDAKNAWAQNFSNIQESNKEENETWEKNSTATWLCKTDPPQKRKSKKARLKIKIYKDDGTKTMESQKLKIINICSVTPLPPMYTYTSTLRNILVYDEPVLLNYPYISEEVVENERPYFDKILGNYDGKFHGDDPVISDPRSFLDLVSSLLKALAKEDPIEHEDGGDEGADLALEDIDPMTQAELERIKILRFFGKKMPPMKIFEAISHFFQDSGDAMEIKEKFVDAYKKVQSGSVSLVSTPSPNIDGPNSESMSAEKAKAAYRMLFCRRCYKYDCILHCFKDDNVVPDFEKYPLRRAVEKSGTVPIKPCGPDCFLYLVDVNDNTCQVIVASAKDNGIRKRSEEWSGGEQSFFRVLRTVNPNNYCAIALIMMTKTCSQVYSFAKQDDISNPKKPPTEVSSQSEEDNTPVTRKQWQHFHKKRLKSSTSHYRPCNHPGTSCDTNCPCFAKGNYCEKFCLCRKNCINRFIGCECKGQCNTGQCQCYLAARECDPDLCKQCGADKFELDSIKCKNICIQRGLHKHMLVGPSDVAGWGVFLKDSAEKNDFISEYCGEVISQIEADRRGAIYDKLKCSYIFNLNDEYVVDAARKASKIRFANHSLNPNCFARVCMVNGDHRIGIYAKEAIAPGEELFFDYSYAQSDRLKYVGREK